MEGALTLRVKAKAPRHRHLLEVTTRSCAGLGFKPRSLPCQSVSFHHTPVREAKGRLIGARVVGGRGMCRQFSGRKLVGEERGRIKSWRR